MRQGGVRDGKTHDMEVLVKILQFVLCFSLLVIVHEAGHFMFAKIFGVRVERFQLFFGRPIVSFRRGGTLYGIGWIPFGGFVKLSGMIDESMDTEHLGRAPEPWEFRSKPAWQRLVIMLGGVIMNLAAALVIYIGISRAWGDAYYDMRDMPGGLMFNEFARDMGFRNGDMVVSVGGEAVSDLGRLVPELAMNQGRSAGVVRGGDTVEVEVPAGPVAEYMRQADFALPRYRFVIGQVVPGSPAEAAGLRAGDTLVSLGGRPLAWFDEWKGALASAAGTTVTVGAARDSAGTAVRTSVPVDVSEAGTIGVAVDIAGQIPVRTREYTLAQAVPAGVKRVGAEIGDYWKQLGMLFKPKTEAYKSIGGPIAIGGIFPGRWDWETFWRITALLSIVLAVMNVLPIPALDGGHALMIAAEMVSGRKPSDKFVIYAQSVGLVLLVALMIYATGNDIMRLMGR